MVPVYAVLALWYGQTVKAGQPDEALRWWALGVFVAAAGSDGIDGWVARHFNQISKFGAFIDPIADKALLLTGVVTLSLVDWGSPGWRLPLWFAALTFGVISRLLLPGLKKAAFQWADVEAAARAVVNWNEIQATAWAVILTTILLFGPKILGVILVFRDKALRRAFGG